MSQPNTITVDKLARLIGRPDTPLIIRRTHMLPPASGPMIRARALA